MTEIFVICNFFNWSWKMRCSLSEVNCGFVMFFKRKTCIILPSNCHQADIMFPSSHSAVWVYTNLGSLVHGREGFTENFSFLSMPNYKLWIATSTIAWKPQKCTSRIHVSVMYGGRGHHWHTVWIGHLGFLSLNTVYFCHPGIHICHHTFIMQ